MWLKVTFACGHTNTPPSAGCKIQVYMISLPPGAQQIEIFVTESLLGWLHSLPREVYRQS